MMKGLDTGKDKVRKICDALRKETLEPAKEEAQQIVEAARLQAETLIQEAHHKIEKMQEHADRDMVKQRAVFEATLSSASRQALEKLKQTIEEKLFNPSLNQLIAGQIQDPKALAAMITAVVKALEKEGTTADLSAYIPSDVSASAVNGFLADHILHRLKEKSVLLSPIGGGIQVKVLDQKITIDISLETLKEFIANFIRKDFRELFFG